MLNLRGLTLEELRKELTSLGEPSYRGDQVFQWLCAKGVTSFEEMHNLPKDLRKKLAEHYSISIPEIKKFEEDTDGTIKFVLVLEDKKEIECVLLPERDHFTLCVSTQVGCPIGCRFCLTGKMGFKRNLEVAEIIGQVVIAKKFVKEKGFELPLRNIVFMGMGEPLLNFENLIKSLKILSHEKGFNFSRKRLTVSTVGIIEKIKRFAKEYPTALALSLHGPNDEIRAKLIPFAKTHSVKELISVCRNFPKIKKSRITIEYVLIKGINDDLECAKELAFLLKGKDFKVNLIPFNPHPALPFERPSEEQIKRFQEFLLSKHILTTIRKSKGTGIRAGCGQLISQVPNAFN